MPDNDTTDVTADFFNRYLGTYHGSRPYRASPIVGNDYNVYSVWGDPDRLQRAVTQPGVDAWGQHTLTVHTGNPGQWRLVNITDNSAWRWDIPLRRWVPAADTNVGRAH